MLSVSKNSRLRRIVVWLLLSLLCHCALAGDAEVLDLANNVSEYIYDDGTEYFVFDWADPDTKKNFNYSLAMCESVGGQLLSHNRRVPNLTVWVGVIGTSPSDAHFITGFPVPDPEQNLLLGSGLSGFCFTASPAKEKLIQTDCLEPNHVVCERDPFPHLKNQWHMYDRGVEYAVITATMNRTVAAESCAMFDAALAFFPNVSMIQDFIFPILNVTLELNWNGQKPTHCASCLPGLHFGIHAYLRYPNNGTDTINGSNSINCTNGTDTINGSYIINCTNSTNETLPGFPSIPTSFPSIPTSFPSIPTNPSDPSELPDGEYVLEYADESDYLTLFGSGYIPDYTPDDPNGLPSAFLLRPEGGFASIAIITGTEAPKQSSMCSRILRTVTAQLSDRYLRPRQPITLTVSLSRPMVQEDLIVHITTSIPGKITFHPNPLRFSREQGDAVLNVSMLSVTANASVGTLHLALEHSARSAVSHEVHWLKIPNFPENASNEVEIASPVIRVSGRDVFNLRYREKAQLVVEMSQPCPPDGCAIYFVPPSSPSIGFGPLLFTAESEYRTANATVEALAPMADPRSFEYQIISTSASFHVFGEIVLTATVWDPIVLSFGSEQSFIYDGGEFKNFSLYVSPHLAAFIQHPLMLDSHFELFSGDCHDILEFDSSQLVWKSLTGNRFQFRIRSQAIPTVERNCTVSLNLDDPVGVLLPLPIHDLTVRQQILIGFKNLPLVAANDITNNYQSFAFEITIPHYWGDTAVVVSVEVPCSDPCPTGSPIQIDCSPSSSGTLTPCTLGRVPGGSQNLQTKCDCYLIIPGGYTAPEESTQDLIIKAIGEGHSIFRDPQRKIPFHRTAATLGFVMMIPSEYDFFIIATVPKIIHLEDQGCGIYGHFSCPDFVTCAYSSTENVLTVTTTPFFAGEFVRIVGQSGSSCSPLSIDLKYIPPAPVHYYPNESTLPSGSDISTGESFNLRVMPSALPVTGCVRVQRALDQGPVSDALAVTSPTWCDNETMLEPKDVNVTVLSTATDEYFNLEVTDASGNPAGQFEAFVRNFTARTLQLRAALRVELVTEETSISPIEQNVFTVTVQFLDQPCLPGNWFAKLVSPGLSSDQFDATAKGGGEEWNFCPAGLNGTKDFKVVVKSPPPGEILITAVILLNHTEVRKSQYWASTIRIPVLSVRKLTSEVKNGRTLFSLNESIPIVVAVVGLNTSGPLFVTPDYNSSMLALDPPPDTQDGYDLGPNSTMTINVTLLSTGFYALTFNASGGEGLAALTWKITTLHFTVADPIQAFVRPETFDSLLYVHDIGTAQVELPLALGEDSVPIVAPAGPNPSFEPSEAVFDLADLEAPNLVHGFTFWSSQPRAGTMQWTLVSTFRTRYVPIVVSPIFRIRSRKHIVFGSLSPKMYVGEQNAVKTVVFCAPPSEATAVFSIHVAGEGDEAAIRQSLNLSTDAFSLSPGVVPNPHELSMSADSPLGSIHLYVTTESTEYESPSGFYTTEVLSLRKLDVSCDSSCSIPIHLYGPADLAMITVTNQFPMEAWESVLVNVSHDSNDFPFAFISKQFPLKFTKKNSIDMFTIRVDSEYDLENESLSAEFELRFQESGVWSTFQPLSPISVTLFPQATFNLTGEGGAPLMSVLYADDVVRMQLSISQAPKNGRKLIITVSAKSPHPDLQSPITFTTPDPADPSWRTNYVTEKALEFAGPSTNRYRTLFVKGLKSSNDEEGDGNISLTISPVSPSDVYTDAYEFFPPDTKTWSFHVENRKVVEMKTDYDWVSLPYNGSKMIRLESRGGSSPWPEPKWDSCLWRGNVTPTASLSLTPVLYDDETGSVVSTNSSWLRIPKCAVFICWPKTPRVYCPSVCSWNDNGVCKDDEKCTCTTTGGQPSRTVFMPIRSIANGDIVLPKKLWFGLVEFSNSQFLSFPDPLQIPFTINELLVPNVTAPAGKLFVMAPATDYRFFHAIIPAPRNPVSTSFSFSVTCKIDDCPRMDLSQTLVSFIPLDRQFPEAEGTGILEAYVYAWAPGGEPCNESSSWFFCRTSFDLNDEYANVAQSFEVNVVPQQQIDIEVLPAPEVYINQSFRIAVNLSHAFSESTCLPDELLVFNISSPKAFDRQVVWSEAERPNITVVSYNHNSYKFDSPGPKGIFVVAIVASDATFAPQKLCHAFRTSEPQNISVYPLNSINVSVPRIIFVNSPKEIEIKLHPIISVENGLGTSYFQIKIDWEIPGSNTLDLVLKSSDIPDSRLQGSGGTWMLTLSDKVDPNVDSTVILEAKSLFPGVGSEFPGELKFIVNDGVQGGFYERGRPEFAGPVNYFYSSVEGQVIPRPIIKLPIRRYVEFKSPQFKFNEFFLSWNSGHVWPQPFVLFESEIFTVEIILKGSGQDHENKITRSDYTILFALGLDPQFINESSQYRTGRTTGAGDTILSFENLQSVKAGVTNLKINTTQFETGGAPIDLYVVPNSIPLEIRPQLQITFIDLPKKIRQCRDSNMGLTDVNSRTVIVALESMPYRQRVDVTAMVCHNETYCDDPQSILPIVSPASLTWEVGNPALKQNITLGGCTSGNFTLILKSEFPEVSSIARKFEVLPLAFITVTDVPTVMYVQQASFVTLAPSDTPLSSTLSVTLTINSNAAGVAIVEYDDPSMTWMEWTPGNGRAPQQVEILSQRAAQAHLVYQVQGPEYKAAIVCGDSGDTDCKSLRIVERSMFEMPFEEEHGPKILLLGENFSFHLNLSYCYDSVEVSPQFSEFPGSLIFTPTSATWDCLPQASSNQHVIATFTAVAMKSTPRKLSRLDVKITDSTGPSEAGKVSYFPSLPVMVEIREPSEILFEPPNPVLFFGRTVIVTVTLLRPPFRGDLNIEMSISPSEYASYFQYNHTVTFDRSPSSDAPPPQRFHISLKNNTLVNIELSFALRSPDDLGADAEFREENLPTYPVETKKPRLINSTLQLVQTTRAYFTNIVYNGSVSVSEFDLPDPGQTMNVTVIGESELGFLLVDPKTLVFSNGSKPTQVYQFTATKPGVYNLTFDVEQPEHLFAYNETVNSAFDRVVVRRPMRPSVAALPSTLFVGESMGGSLTIPEIPILSESLTARLVWIPLNLPISVEPERIVFDKGSESKTKSYSLKYAANEPPSTHVHFQFELQGTPQFDTAKPIDIGSITFERRHAIVPPKVLSYTVFCTEQAKVNVSVTSLPPPTVTAGYQVALTPISCVSGIVTITPASVTFYSNSSSRTKEFTVVGNVVGFCTMMFSTSTVKAASFDPTSPAERISFEIRPLYLPIVSYLSEIDVTRIEIFEASVNAIYVRVSLPLFESKTGNPILMQVESSDPRVLAVIGDGLVFTASDLTETVIIEGFKAGTAKLVIRVISGADRYSNREVEVQVFSVFKFEVRDVPQSIHAGVNNSAIFSLRPQITVEEFRESCQARTLLSNESCSLVVFVTTCKPEAYAYSTSDRDVTFLQWNLDMVEARQFIEFQSIVVVGKARIGNCSLVVEQSPVNPIPRIQGHAVSTSFTIISAPVVTLALFYEDQAAQRLPAVAFRTQAVTIRLRLDFALFVNDSSLIMVSRSNTTGEIPNVIMESNTSIADAPYGFNKMMQDAEGTSKIKWVINTQRNALEIVLEPNPKFETFAEEIVTVTVTRFALEDEIWLNPERRSVYIAIDPDQQEPPELPARDTLQVMTFAAAAISGVVSLASAAQAGKVLTISSMMDCPSKSWRDEQDNLPFFIAPLPFRLGTNEDLGIYAGAVLSNLLFFVIILLLHYGLCAFLRHIRGPEYSSRHSMAVFAFPSLLWFPVFLYSQTTLQSGSRILMYSPNNGIRAFGAIAVPLIVLILPGAIIRLLMTTGPLEYTPPKRSTLLRWLFEHGTYVHPHDSTWVSRYARPIVMYRTETTWCIALEVFIIIVLALITAVQPKMSSQCVGRIIVAIIVFLVQFVVVAIAQPFNSKFDNLFFMLGYAVQVAAMSIILASFVRKTDLYAATELSSQVLLGFASMLVIKAFIDCIFFFRKAAKEFTHVDPTSARRFQSNDLEEEMVPKNGTDAKKERGAEENKPAERAETTELNYFQRLNLSTKFSNMAARSIGRDDAGNPVVRTGFQRALDPSIVGPEAASQISLVIPGERPPERPDPNRLPPVVVPVTSRRNFAALFASPPDDYRTEPPITVREAPADPSRSPPSIQAFLQNARGRNPNLSASPPRRNGNSSTFNL